MKILAISLFCLFTQTVSLAANVGDKSYHVGTYYIKEHGLFPATAELTITEADKKSYVIEQITTFAGEVNKTTERIPVEQLVDQSKGAEIVKNCKKLNGKIEKVEIRTGEVLDTCKLTKKLHYGKVVVYQAAVPFGRASQSIFFSNGHLLTLTLESYSSSK